MSQVSSDAILAALSSQYAKVGVTTVNNLPDLEALVALQPDLVFLGMKFVPLDPLLGRKSPRIWLADYLDEHGIAYTGSSQGAHELELDKQLAKQHVQEAGLKTAPFCVVRQSQQLTKESIALTFPLFIKPLDRGGGLGIGSDSVVHNFNELQAKVQSIATELGSDSLVEEYLPGREFSVAILKYENSEVFAVMPIELIAPVDESGLRILGGKVKSSNTEQAIMVTDQVIKSQITALALDVFRALDGRSYGRIDIRLNKTGTPYFLEANLLPSLISGYGSFPKACVSNMHLDYEQMIFRIARLGFAQQQLPNEENDQCAEMGILSTVEALF